jgi:hypothetical protein
VAVTTKPESQGHPALVSDGAGGAIIVYEEFASGGTRCDIYAQRTNVYGYMQWNSSGVALCTSQEDQESPIVVSDGVGGAIVAWYDDWDDSGENYDIYAQRVDASGAVRWMANGVAICTATGLQEDLAIASDSTGGAIVTWCDEGGDNDDIYAQRVLSCGITVDVPHPDPDHARVLIQNVPNPFKSITRIAFSLERETLVRLQIFDGQGHLVRTLVDDIRQPNRYVEYWDGMDDDGRQMPSGVYFCQVKAGDLIEAKRMVLVR